MNYFLKCNENLYDQFDFEIDKFNLLLEDMVGFWNKRVDRIDPDNKKIKKLKYQGNISEEIGKNNPINLTCDYIGPSRYIAKEKRGFTNAEILEYYIPSRVFGGHMIWPSKEVEINNKGIKKSINTARSYFFKERIDFSLFGIKQWYEKSHQKKLHFFDVLEGNKNWFAQFENFKGFIDFFMFNSFVTEDYDVFDLSSYKNKKFIDVISDYPTVGFTKREEYPENMINAYIPKDYNKYIDGCLVAIYNRNIEIDIFLIDDEQ